jgi:hypothetical protein
MARATTKLLEPTWGAILPIGLAAASTGVVIPSLRALVEQSGHGATAGGVFSAAHVLGGVVGAALGARALRAAGSARRLAIAALIASVALTVVMAAVPALPARIALRFADGTFHLLAITALVAAATSGDAARRASRAIAMGVAIVLGVAAGLGLGGQLGAPALALGVAAALTAGSLVGVIALVRDEPVEPAVRRAPGRGSIAPALLAFGERFIFGTLSVAMPFLASKGRVGLVLGVFMTASVIALPVARRYALAWGPRRLAVRSTLGFTLALAAAGVVDVLASPVTAIAWAVAGGAAAGALYASALVLAARSTAVEDRVRDMATVHAAGSAGHALGALVAGVLVAVLPGMLAVVVPGIGIVVAATIGVWITVPEAARDCPVIGGLARDERTDGAPAQPPIA